MNPEEAEASAGASTGGGNFQSRRRRRQASAANTRDATATSNAVTSAVIHGRKTAASTVKKDDRSDDEDDSDDEKGLRSSRGEERTMYRKSCSLGRFALNPCLCTIQSALSCWRRWKFRLKPRGGDTWTGRATSDEGGWTIAGSLSVPRAILASCVLLLLGATLISPSDSSHTWRWSRSLRPVTDANVDQIAVRIPRLDYDRTDIGGWMFLRRFFLPAIPFEDADFDDSLVPDYNDLALNLSSTERGRPREIHPNDTILAARYWERKRRPDPRHIHYDEPPEAVEDTASACRRPRFKLRYYPTCNAAHEVSLERDYDPARAAEHQLADDVCFDSFYISNGHYRDVWVVNEPALATKSIFKTSRWKHDFAPEIFINVLNDALVMERLSKSPRIVDIYGHCGTTVWVEPVPHEVEVVIVPGTGFMKDPKDLHDELDVNPLNPYTVDEKLFMALQMAESLADLHGYSEGVM